MNPAPLQIGDIVRIIGPNWCDSKEKLGAIFQITEETGHGFSTGGHSWYPAASLRKVRVVDEDELQIGDWVEVTGPDDHGFGHTIGEKFRISLLNRPGAPFPWASDTGRAFYPASSLRKLSPEEVQEHHRTHEAPIFPPRLEKIEARLSAIESKLADISPKDRQFSPGETVGEAFQGHIDKINEALEPLAEEICKDPDFLSKILDERLQEIQAFSWGSGLWTIDISRGNMHLLNSGRDGGKLGEWVKRMMQDE